MADASRSGVAPRGAGNGAREQQGGFSVASIVRMLFFWYVLSNIFKKKPPPDSTQLMRNLFNRGDVLDLWVYLTESETFSDFNDEESLIWYEPGIPLAGYGPGSKRSLEYLYFPSKSVQQNGTLFAHIFFAKTGFVPDPSDPSYERLFTFSKTHPLIIYRPPPKIVHQHNLLGSSITEDKEKNDIKVDKEDAEVIQNSKANQTSETSVDRPFISYFKPNLTIDLIDDFTAYVKDRIPDVVRPHINYDEETGGYFPTLSMTEFWLLKDKWIPMNETVTNVTLSLSVGSLPSWKWQLYLSFDKSAELQTSMGTSTEGEMDELKRVFLEGNPVLLGVTFFVSILHSIFDFLTFKNDIQFWRENKSMEGLSARTVVINFFCQFIVFLYLLDNNTSWLILISSGISVAIEFWKIGKAMDIKIDRSGRFPIIRFSDRESYKMNKTKEYDEIATRYLSYVLYPLVIAYAIYSLIYESHKSWYSWILTSLTSCVYIFGFIMMCPQLFINYKLKSVAHLPWRQMTYKFLNTIIDDLFAFVIKMPTLHRLSVFRDDVIFLIYIYQRWIYPVDKKRVNEFGFDGESHEPQLKDETPSETTPAIDSAEEASKKSTVGISEEGLTQRSKPKKVKSDNPSEPEGDKKDD